MGSCCSTILVVSMLIQSILFVSIFAGIFNAASSLDQEKDDFIGFGTKTSYYPNSNNDTSNPFPPECKPVLFWQLARHGTRNPKGKTIRKMKELLPLIRDALLMAPRNGSGTLDAATISSLSNWNFDLVEEDKFQLTESGRIEHLQMGERWKLRLQSTMKVDPKRTEVRSSHEQRCLDSAAAFIDGMFGQQLYRNVDNRLLRYGKHCNNYYKNKGKGQQEIKKFMNSEVFMKLIEDIKRRTGLTLSRGQVKVIWNMCRTENSWFPEDYWSPWCKVLSLQGIKAFEFMDDLGTYYGDGYGNPKKMLMTQPLWKDIIDRLDDIKKPWLDSVNPSIVPLFSHEDVIRRFTSSLGISKDQHLLKASDFPANNREWRTSKISSFAANLELVVLKCKDSQNQNQVSEDYKIALFQQEKAVMLPNNIETVDEFVAHFRHIADQDFDRVCGNY